MHVQIQASEEIQRKNISFSFFILEFIFVFVTFFGCRTLTTLLWFENRQTISSLYLTDIN